MYIIYIYSIYKIYNIYNIYLYIIYISCFVLSTKIKKRYGSIFFRADFLYTLSDLISL